MNKATRRGITLIEVLIVLAILALLFQLILPAVQMARESARQVQCQNNLRQVAFACVAHTDVNKHFPTGGWNSSWMGDPNRGYDKKQPGGWAYNILPFIEQQALHDAGHGVLEPERRKLAAQVYGTPLPIFNCSSRRLPHALPFAQDRIMKNVDQAELARLNKAARSDYAGNTGIVIPRRNFAIGPSTYEEGDQWENGKDPKKSWIASENYGVIYQRSEVTPAMITDGLSRTFLIGEKFVPFYPKGTRTHADDQSLYVGFSFDNNRLGRFSTQPIADRMVQVKNERARTLWRFGSAHPTCFNMACCDGSVHKVSYDVDMILFSAMSTRNLGEKKQLAN